MKYQRGYFYYNHPDLRRVKGGCQHVSAGNNAIVAMMTITSTKVFVQNSKVPPKCLQIPANISPNSAGSGVVPLRDYKADIQRSDQLVSCYHHSHPRVGTILGQPNKLPR